uniref:Ig-like domain-containing protein n=1 Tax=Gadus morhua TaxID=8049 RepID=A0A8C5FCU0_GADMO
MHVHITVVTAAPRIRPPRLTYGKVKPGGNVRFDCEAVGEPKPKILWMLPNNDVIAASHERYLMHVNGSLDIRDVKMMDVGQYVCMARNPVGENRKVYRLEGIIRAVSGEPLFVHCLVDGSPRPSVSWTVPGGHTLTGTQALGRYRLLENGTLVVRDTTIYDRGTYVCRAQNDAGEAVLKVPVIIIAYTPRITTWPPPNVRAMVGAPVQLSCGAIGIPKPEINWDVSVFRVNPAQ